MELTEVALVTPLVADAEPFPTVAKREEDIKQAAEETPTSSSMGTSLYRPQQRRDPSRDISINVLEKFSMVTKFARDTTAHLFGESRFLGNSEMDLDRAPSRSALLLLLMILSLQY